MRCAQPGWWIQVFALHTFQTTPERVFAWGVRFSDIFWTVSAGSKGSGQARTRERRKDASRVYINENGGNAVTISSAAVSFHHAATPLSPGRYVRNLLLKEVKPTIFVSATRKPLLTA